MTINASSAIRRNVQTASGQIFAAVHPQRVRSLTLTDCDTHDNWPSEAFKPFLAMAAAGELRDTLDTELRAHWQAAVEEAR